MPSRPSCLLATDGCSAPGARRSPCSMWCQSRWRRSRAAVPPQASSGEGRAKVDGEPLRPRPPRLLSYLDPLTPGGGALGSVVAHPLHEVCDHLRLLRLVEEVVVEAGVDLEGLVGRAGALDELPAACGRGDLVVATVHGEE